MANSGTVTAGSAALASQYNNLRDDVLNVTTGHTHTGASENGKKVEGSAIASTGATNGQVLTADGAGNAAFTTLAGAGALGGTTVSVAFSANTPTSVQYSMGARAVWAVSGGGTEIYGVTDNPSTSTTTIYKFNLGSASTAASTTTASLAGTYTAKVAAGYGFESGTAMLFAEQLAANTTGNVTITLRKYNSALTSNMWNAVIWNNVAFATSSNYDFFPFITAGPRYESSIGIWHGFDRVSGNVAGTSNIWTVNDASGSVYSAPFYVSSTAEYGGVHASVFVPPVSGSNGTIYAWGKSITATGSTATYYLISYTVGSASISAASTVTSSLGFPRLNEALTSVDGVSQSEAPISAFWDSGATAIVLQTKPTGIPTTLGDKPMFVGLDRTAGSVIFRSLQTSGTIYRIEDATFRTAGWDPTTRLFGSFNSSRSLGGFVKFGAAGEFYSPITFVYKTAIATHNRFNAFPSFAGAGSATHFIVNEQTNGSTISTQNLRNLWTDVTVLSAESFGRMVYFDRNLSSQWAPATITSASAFPMVPVGDIGMNSSNIGQFNNPDFPLYLPANQSLSATFSRVVAYQGESTNQTTSASTGTFAVRTIKMA
jgi:hypothetical protein